MYQTQDIFAHNRKTPKYGSDSLGKVEMETKYTTLETNKQTNSLLPLVCYK